MLPLFILARLAACTRMHATNRSTRSSPRIQLTHKRHIRERMGKSRAETVSGMWWARKLSTSPMSLVNTFLRPPRVWPASQCMGSLPRCSRSLVRKSVVTCMAERCERVVERRLASQRAPMAINTQKKIWSMGQIVFPARCSRMSQAAR